MSIRLATPEDAVDIAEVQVGAWRVAYRGIMPDTVLESFSVRESAARWRTRLSEPLHGTFVAEEGGAVVGFADAGRSRDADAVGGVGELLAIYVAPDFWNRGQGRALWDAARQLLAAEEFSEATVWVLEANERARRFYERLGFVLEPGTTKITERDGTGLILLRYRARLDEPA